MNKKREIKVPFQGKGYKVMYTAEVIDLGIAPLDSVNVYSVSVEDAELQPVLGAFFSILHHPLNLPTPAFSLRSNGNVEEINLKKTIAQQIINNPTE